MIIMGCQGLTQATQLVLGMILVRMITKDTVGTYRQVALAYGLIGGVLSMQIESSLYYFLPKFGRKMGKNLVAQSLFATTAIAAVIGVAMFLSAGLLARQFGNPALEPLIRIYALFPLLERTVKLLPAFLISLDKVLHSGVFTFLNAVFLAGSVVAVFAAGFGIREALWAKLVVESAFALAGVALMARFARFGQWRIDKTLLLQQLNYCWPLMATTIVGILSLRLDGLLISSYFPKDVYAVYSVGALELPVIALITSSLSSAIMPNMVAEADRGNVGKALGIWHEAARKSSLVLFPCFGFFLVCGRDFIVMLYTRDYEAATWPFLIYLARMPLRVAIYSAIFRALGFTRSIAVSAAISLLVNALVSVALLLLGNHGFLSYIGPSIGTFVGAAAAVAFFLRILCRKTGATLASVMRWKELGRVFAVALACAVILWMIPLPVENALSRMAIRFPMFVVIYLAMMLLTRSFNNDEWGLAKSALSFLGRAVGLRIPKSMDR